MQSRNRERHFNHCFKFACVPTVTLAVPLAVHSAVSVSDSAGPADSDSESESLSDSKVQVLPSPNYKIQHFVPGISGLKLNFKI